MPPNHFSSASRALYRIFVAPNLRSPTSIPLLYTPTFASSPPPTLQSHSAISRTQIRGLKYKKKDTNRHALSDHYVLNNAIQATHINLVDEQRTYRPNVPLQDALFALKHQTHFLVQMTPGKVDEFGRPDPEDLPMCRIISKIALRLQHEKNLEIMRRQAKSQGTKAAPKNLELNWAIAGGDLKHRLEKFKEFLRDGRRVEILLGPKKKGRRATEQEAAAVIEAVRDAAAECKGASEIRSDGTVGGVMTVVFDGKKTKEKKNEAEAS